MTRRVVTVPGRRYTDSPDVAVPDGERAWALVEARLVDELTGQPVEGPVRLTPAGTAFARPGARAAVHARVAPGGIVGLVGVPRRVLPRHGTKVYQLGITVDAEGYVPATRSASFAALATFPGEFAPLQLGDIVLHRRGIELRGRVMHRKANGDLEMSPGASVSVTTVWRACPTLTVPVPAQPPNLLALTVPLYADRLAGPARVRSCTLAANTLQLKRLMRPAAPGERVVQLSDRLGLSTNRILGIDRADSGRIEYIVIASVDTSAPLAGPGAVTLAHPLALPHGEGAEAMPVTRQGPLGPSVGFALDAIPGDGTLVLNSMAALGVPTAVEIFGGAAVREYHLALPPDVLTDSQGFYRLPPISREAQLRVRAELGALGLGPVATTLSLDYPAREQRVDFVFP